MYDITLKKIENAEEYGFKKIYYYEDIKNKILEFKDIVEAEKNKNKRKLALVKNLDINIGLIKSIAAKNKLLFLIDLSRVIESKGFNRAKEISKIRKFLYFAIKYNLKFALVSFSKEEVRTARELCHIGTLVGLNIGQAKISLKRLEKYLGNDSF